LLNIEVASLEIATTEDLPEKCPRQHTSMYDASNVASSIASSVADSNDSNSFSATLSSVGSVECLDGVLPSTACWLVIA
jgi:hypothetical protein